MPLRAARVGRVGVIGHPVAKTAVVAKAVSPVPRSDDYDGESSVFSGTVNWVQMDLGEDADDADHLISPEERLRVVMARQ